MRTDPFKNRPVYALPLILILLLCPWLSAVSQTSDNFFEFAREQGWRCYTQVPHEVLAFYYGWYGPPKPTASGDVDPAWGTVNASQHEILKTARYPVNGAYDSHSPMIVDWQIDQAKSHGITGFVVSWWGTGPEALWNDRSLQLLMERAEEKDFKISIYWEQAPGEGQGQIDRAISEISYLLHRNGRSRAFLKVNGRPVIFAYGRVIEQVPTAAWPEIIAGIRAKAGDFALIADGQQGSYARLFDGIHSYDFPELPTELAQKLTMNNLGDRRAWAAHYYAEGVALARRCGHISCLMVFPGTDARKAYKFDWQTDRLDGQAYRSLWEEALQANPDWVIINSWNEWPEGSEIEPSLELGEKYLEITAEFSKRFLASEPVKAPPAIALPKFAPGTTRDVDKLLAGRKIAVLTQDRMSDAEFWAAYCGATLQRLDWPDLVNPAVFNASNFPALIHIGQEHYRSSIKVTDDVVQSLGRYLRHGGFLAALPTRPWPLLYDDNRKSMPHGITDVLELGVDNGFDEPPGGTPFTFQAKTNALFGLSLTAPYPKGGDLRWRPGNRARVPNADIYVPLVQLKDNTGKWQGDAVVYVEHRTPSLAGGKTLYVWMRTPEAFDPEIFYPSLYQFVSTRLKPLRAAP